MLSPFFAILPGIGIVITTPIAMAAWRTGIVPRAAGLAGFFLSCATTGPLVYDVGGEAALEALTDWADR